MKTDKKLNLTTTCGRNFTIDVHEIADARATYYVERDKDTTYDEEYSFLCEDDFEVTDWLFNQMDWYECKTLVELERDSKRLIDLELEDYSINGVK